MEKMTIGKLISIGQPPTNVPIKHAASRAPAGLCIPEVNIFEIRSMIVSFYLSSDVMK